MKKISLKRGMALFLAVSLIQAMMPFPFVQAAENSLELEIDFTAATYGTVTYSVSQDGTTIDKNASELRDVYTIDNGKEAERVFNGKSAVDYLKEGANNLWDIGEEAVQNIQQAINNTWNQGAKYSKELFCMTAE